jgi:hypothetical protein
MRSTKGCAAVIPQDARPCNGPGGCRTVVLLCCSCPVPLTNVLKLSISAGRGSLRPGSRSGARPWGRLSSHPQAVRRRAGLPGAPRRLHAGRRASCHPKMSGASIIWGPTVAPPRQAPTAAAFWPAQLRFLRTTMLRAWASACGKALEQDSLAPQRLGFSSPPWAPM